MNVNYIILSRMRPEPKRRADRNLVSQDVAREVHEVDAIFPDMLAKWNGLSLPSGPLSSVVRIVTVTPSLAKALQIAFTANVGPPW